MRTLRAALVTLCATVLVASLMAAAASLVSMASAAVRPATLGLSDICTVKVTASSTATRVTTKAHATCSQAPVTWHSRSYLYRQTMTGWKQVKRGNVRSAVPVRAHPAVLGAACNASEYRGGLTVWGTSALSGAEKPRTYYSKPVYTGCGSQHPNIAPLLLGSHQTSGPPADCYLNRHNPDANIWVHVSGSGVPTIHGHAHLHCYTQPNEIHGKIHFQKFVFPPLGEPAHNGHWKELVASGVYTGLDEHMNLVVPDHHIKWRSGRLRVAFEFWGRSSGTTENGGNRYGKGYFCTSDLDIPKSPPSVSFDVRISPDTHRCYPPPA